MRLRVRPLMLIVTVTILLGNAMAAQAFFFSTGNPDGLISTLSRSASPGKLETETADDFILTQTTILTHATFTGLVPSGFLLTTISNVEIEFSWMGVHLE